ncbi:MAG: CDP-alcohol phosphatidyltransferase family protein [Myxococcales bacterium]|nr:CDP-alcohol phosphatidyltransferase family protein [Myxococcales bacterium]
MGRYRARDLLLPPSLLSLARAPLAGAFVLAMDHPWVELGVLTLAGATDVADGWWARRFDQVTATGAVVDAITDKIFALTVVVALVVGGRLEAWAIVLLATREIGEAPLVAWWALSHRKRRALVEQPMANVPGKVATVLQFATIASALFDRAHTHRLLVATAAAGAVAAVSYWARDLRARSS